MATTAASSPAARTASCTASSAVDRSSAGAARAEVSADFDVSRVPAAQEWLVAQALDEGDGACLVRRTLEAGGRSRAFVNGRPATVAQLRELVPRLSKAGYKLVTLNELYGLPTNETGTLQDHSQVETPLPYTRIPQTLHQEDYLHDVYLMQQRLSELGFLTAKYNGYYGKTTAAAVRAFQASIGLSADGVCGEDTWNALFG